MTTLKKYLLPISIILVGLSFSANAQQDAQFSHYAFNGMYLNPAYAGIQKAPVIRGIYRNQWLGYTSDFDDGTAGNTNLLSADLPLLPINGGIGLNLINDIQPSLRTTTVNLSLSKHIVVGKGRLSLGVQGSFSNVLIGRKDIEWRPSDGVQSIPIDYAIPDQNRWVENLIDMGAGLWYEHDKFYVGVSMNKLLEDEFSYGGQSSWAQNNVDHGTQRHMYITAGYRIELDRDMVLTPTALFKTDFAYSTRYTHSFEIGGRIDLEEKHWGGLNFRQGGAFGLLVGTSFMDDNQLKVGYALDAVVAGTRAKAGTSHEIMIAYYLPEITKQKPPIRTPRYKQY